MTQKPQADAPIIEPLGSPAGWEDAGGGDAPSGTVAGPPPKVAEPGQLAPASPDPKPKINEQGRALLRAGMAAIRVGSAKGNELADWLDKQQNVTVLIYERVPTPDPPLVVHSEPDPDPAARRGWPWRRGISREEMEVTEGYEE